MVSTIEESPWKPPIQIFKPRGNPDRCLCLRFDHRNRLPKLLAQVPDHASVYTDHRVTRKLDMYRPAWALAGAVPDTMTLFGSAVTVTGNSLVYACWPSPKAALQYSCRRGNTWFAFTPYSRAIGQTDRSLARPS
jgi:hypothetical protein